MNKLVEASSVSVIGPASSDDHVKSMDTSEPSHSLSTAPDPSKAQFKKFNKLFASHLTRLEALLARVSSQEQVDSLAFHPPPIFSAPTSGTSGWFFKVLVQLHQLAWMPLFRVNQSL